RHLAADRLAVAHLESGDRLSRLGDHRLLSGNQAEVIGSSFDLLSIVDTFADAHVDDDLFNHRHLHPVRVAELIGQLLANDLFEIGLEPRRDPLLRRSRLGRAWRGVALRSLVALLGLRTLLRLLCLIALVGPRTFTRSRRLLGFHFAFRISHRSQLPTAWPPAPCGDPRLYPRI